MSTDDALLVVSGLRTYFRSASGTVPAVAGVSLEVRDGEVVALVGESGCGKTATAYSIARLIKPPGWIAGGRISFAGRDVLALSQRELASSYRGSQVSLIFQEPSAAFDPLCRIGSQIEECMAAHTSLSRSERREKVLSLLESVGVGEPARRAKQFPFEFSGGMLQRAMIALAMSCDPRLIIADEPTTSLDATTQLQVMEVLLAMTRARNTALLLITHNLGLVARYADRVYVMRSGEVVETGPVERVYSNPVDPYTRLLWSRVPRVDGGSARS